MADQELDLEVTPEIQVDLDLDSEDGFTGYICEK